MRFASLAVLKSGALALLVVGCSSPPGGAPMATPTGPMSFFVTSTGSGKGADLGGLAGADAHCQKLGAATGAAGRTWRA